MAGHEHHHHEHVHLSEADWDAMAARTELEGEVLLPFVTEAASWAAEVRGGEPVRWILDLGSGPGVGTCELARVFPEAEVVAVDGSTGMLDRARRRADEHGLRDRVRTHRAELPDGLDDLEPADLIWASMSLHHVGDQVGLVRLLRERLAPGGLLAIAELDEPVRVLPDHIGDGLGRRLERAATGWFDAMRDGLPDTVPGAEVADMVVEAGFTLVGSRVSRLDLDPPLDDAARRFVISQLERQREHLDGRLDADDVRTLDDLLDEDAGEAASRRRDLFVRASRLLVLAER